MTRDEHSIKSATYRALKFNTRIKSVLHTYGSEYGIHAIHAARYARLYAFGRFGDDARNVVTSFVIPTTSPTKRSQRSHGLVFVRPRLVFFLSCVLAKLTRSAPDSGASRSMR